MNTIKTYLQSCIITINLISSKIMDLSPGDFLTFSFFHIVVVVVVVLIK